MQVDSQSLLRRHVSEFDNEYVARGLPYLEILKDGRRATFLPSNTKWRTNDCTNC